MLIDDDALKRRVDDPASVDPASIAQTKPLSNQKTGNGSACI
jgi:hypothetical protein